MQQFQQTKSKFIIMEGNIGTGKSTLLSILKKNKNINIIPEPADRWQNVNETDNLLDLFYKDTSRWAYTLQSYAFLTRVQVIIEELNKVTSASTHVIERSVYCDRFCFAKNCYESGNMTALEWEAYKESFAWLVKNVTPQPSGFIYLRADPETSFKRVIQRSRSEEQSIPLSYLKALHDKHDDWLINKKDNLPALADTPVLVLDCNEEFQAVPEEADRLVYEITEFINQLESFSLPGYVALTVGVSP